MTVEMISRKMADQLERLGPFFAFMTGSRWNERAGQPGISDFVVGNPHELPLPAFVDALQRWAVPRRNDWFAYTLGEPAAREAVAASLQQRTGMAFAADDIFLTNGGFAAIAVSLATVVDPGDEVIFVSPPWFFYEALIRHAGGIPVRVKLEPPAFDLDPGAVAAAITPRTRAIIVNSPHNPTGRIYPAATLEALAGVLAAASVSHGRTIHLLSDEAYARIVFDAKDVPTPTAFYPSSFLLYTYGKTLLTPGQRIGYLALPPTMPAEDRAALRPAIITAQLALGWAVPNALLQHALPDLDRLSIDIAHLERKRDRMVGELRAMGYELATPEGTFYLLPRSPWADDLAFVELLAERDVFVLPGSLAEIPGYFRISLTANDEMIERALPHFAAALAHARAQPAAPALVGAATGER
jgi:aspartate aminotransferase